MMNPKLKIMGIEAVKSSTIQVCRGKIKQAINLIMTKDKILYKSLSLILELNLNKCRIEQISLQLGLVIILLNINMNK